MAATTLIFLSLSLPLILSNFKASAQGITAAPPLLDGNTEYKLRGCYQELNSSQAEGGNRSVGQAGEYFSPALNPDNLTVDACLDGCGDALAPRGGGKYIYTAVENARECFCGVMLSPLSAQVDTGYCSSPCTGDADSSCGGSGYLVLYGLRSSSVVTARPTTISSSTSRPTSSTSSTSTATVSSSSTIIPVPFPSKGLSSAALGGIIAAVVIISILLVALIAFLLKRRHDKRKRDQENSSLGFLGGDALKQEKNVQNKKHLIQLNSPVRDGLEQERMFGGVGTAYRAPDHEEYRIDSGSNTSGSRDGMVFTSWRQTSIPPVSPDDVTGSVEMGDFVSDVSRGDLESGDGRFNSMDGKQGFRYPNGEIAELPVEDDPLHDRRNTFETLSSGEPGTARALESPVLGEEARRSWTQ